MIIEMNDLLKDCKLPKKEFKTLSSIKIALKQLGNVSVPGTSFVCGLARDSMTQRDQYIIQVSSRWGIAFEIALYNRE